MSAVVVCPEGEEVYCDEHGRVHVQFQGLRATDHSHAAGAGTCRLPAMDRRDYCAEMNLPTVVFPVFAGKGSDLTLTHWLPNCP